MLYSYKYNGCNVASLAEKIEAVMPMPDSGCLQDGMLGILYEEPLNRTQQRMLDAIVDMEQPDDRSKYSRMIHIASPEIPFLGRRKFKIMFSNIPFAIFPYGGSQWLVCFNTRIERSDEMGIRKSFSATLDISNG